MKKLVFIILTCSLVACSNKTQIDYCQKVNPFIGAEGEGHTFPGASLPYGMVKLGPDCDQRMSNSGYVAGTPIHGFSHVHVSGTGGGPKYGNILVMPLVGTFNPKNFSVIADTLVAHPGYFAAKFAETGIKTEMTVTHSTGLHQITFPATDSARILFDVSSFLGRYACCNEAQKLLSSSINIESSTIVSGFQTLEGGWNMGEPYTVYFYAQTDIPSVAYGVWRDTILLESVAQSVFNGDTLNGAWLQFDTRKTNQVRLKVGISFVSVEKAKANLENELQEFDFDKTYAQANKIWNQALSTIEITNTEPKWDTVFYSALYRSLLMPVNRTGENPKWNSDQPYFDDFYAIWDTYRTLHPLLTIIDPGTQRKIVQSLIEIYQHDGYMPDARSGNDNGRTQGGSNCDVLITDAYVKGLTGIDYQTGYEAMIKNAEVPPGGDERKHGRGGISDYNTLGYVSTNFERAGSRTVEFAYNDFCIAVLAKALGKNTEVEKYSNRSKNWQNLMRDTTTQGAKGFIWPRHSNGDWIDTLLANTWVIDHVEKLPFSLLTAGSWGDFFYESHSWEYSLYVPHDVRSLINVSGGAKQFEQKLDTFFMKGYYNMWNEPSFLTPCLYNYIGVPAKTASIVRSTIQKYYNTSAKGLPGNDDAGAMSSWFVFHALGFFPVAGQDIYLISSPMFVKSKIRLENNTWFEIIANNTSEKNKYIDRVELNGKPYNKTWFTHNDIVKGGKLELWMSSEPDSKWGTAPEDAPPSLRGL